MLGGDTCNAEDGNWYASDTGAWVCAILVLMGVLERTKVIKAIGSTLQKTAMKIITIVNRDKDHIPPITTSETNPFPYHIEVILHFLFLYTRLIF